jgi:hypothetical protein
MKKSNEQGMALVATILVLALMGALLLGFIATVANDQNSGRTARDQTKAYAAAHAGLEKLTSDMGQLFAANYAPTCTDLNNLVGTGRPPVLPDILYTAPGGGSGYTIQYTCVSNHPQAENTPRAITAGPFQGFQGLVTPYEILVTARTTTGGEVRMRRGFNTVAIPVFQFGMFSENDLSFFAGPAFNFGGRVHTNSNLFVAQGDGGTLTLADRVTVLGEVVRKNLSNGWLTSSSYTGTVNVAKSTTQTVTMDMNKGSWAAATPQLPGAPSLTAPGALTPTNDNTWADFSKTTTAGYMLNGRTGAKRLVLPLVQMGAQPIDLIRRPAVNSNENVTNAPVFGQRYYSMASVRILLSDYAADLTGLPTVTAGAPIDLTNLAGAGYTVDASHPPIARAPAAASNALADINAAATLAARQNYLTPTVMGGSPLITGVIKIEKQLPDHSWQDVTLEILNRGIAGRNLANAGTLNTPGTTCGADPNPNAVIRLQRVRDNPTSNAPCGAGSLNSTDYWPNVLYDAREALPRDTSALQSEKRHYLGGVMHYVELDVAQLSAWMAAQGANIMQETGYVVYFSDRRGNFHNPANSNRETGEYGFEDVVNPGLTNGFPGNGTYAYPPTLNSGSVPEAGEDFNGDGQLQTYGGVPHNGIAATTYTANTPPLPEHTATAATSPLANPATRPWIPLDWNYYCSNAGACTPTAFDLTRPMAARVNPPIFFRRALKLTNGGTVGAIITPGLTVVAENPVYVQGNYNANGSFGATGDGHRACAIIADAVTMLSNQWNDIRSFLSPHDPFGSTVSPGRVANADVWYRTAIVAGKGIAFAHPTGFSSYQDFGTDGGAHNFLRYIEKWDSWLNYRGSIVSFYTSRQAVGTYKCCQNVYDPPSRGYNFDQEFLTPSLLPPRTPMFRDVNILTFRQVLRATQ